jgi:uncharacterized protein YndB with AHSA1/START domain
VAENEISIDAPRERVFDVLSDPGSYPRWVGGARTAHDADGDFPEPGSSFAYEAGVGPLTLEDRTEVVSADRPRRLVLRASFKGLGGYVIELELLPQGAGTLVRMREEPADGLVETLDNALADGALRLRNAYSLKRLKALVESS